MTDRSSRLPPLNERSREIFRQIVDAYLATGQATGSRNISRMLPMALSPASVRNVMADLESLGLIQASHSSAGRRPTELGLRFFVDALMEVGDLNATDQALIQQQVASPAHKNLDDLLKEASSLLSDLSKGAGVVLTTKRDSRLKHIEFLALDPQRALVILVDEDGGVENRILPLPSGLPSSALTEASNYLNSHIRGRTLGEARLEISKAREQARKELDILTSRMVDAGLASWAEAEEGFAPQLIVRGQANLLDDVSEAQDLDRVRHLLEDLENQKELIELLSKSEQAEGVKIYIGSENRLFSLSGSSMVVAPFHNSEQKLIGALGIIGPTRLNYARIVPMVDYTAQIISRLAK